MTGSSAAGAGRGRAQMAPGRTITGSGAPKSSESTTDALTPESGAQRVWRLWFSQRLGPRRTETTTIGGVKVKARVRRMEFPPGPNGSRGNHYGHGKWVKEWRSAAKDTARAHCMPALGRVRISAVFYRRALGTADEDNDRIRCKPLVDGLRDAGVLLNDTRGHVVYGSCTEQRAHDGRIGLELIVEALEPAATGGER